MSKTLDDRAYLHMALEEAWHALVAGDWPIGAVLVDVDGQVVGQARNTRHTDDNRLRHAELQLLLTHGAMARDQEGLLTLYASLEPCVMCLSAAILARIRRIVWACGDPFGGGVHLLRLDAWPPAQFMELVSEPFADLKEASKQYILEYLELVGDLEKLALFRAL